MKKQDCRKADRLAGLHYRLRIYLDIFQEVKRAIAKIEDEIARCERSAAASR
jgi:hypothetical protein